MANEKQVKNNEPSKTGTANLPVGKIELPTQPLSPVVFSETRPAGPTKEDRIINALITGFVVMGYMANGGRPTTPQKVEELKALVKTVKELL